MHRDQLGSSQPLHNRSGFARHHSCYLAPYKGLLDCCPFGAVKNKATGSICILIAKELDMPRRMPGPCAALRVPGAGLAAGAQLRTLGIHPVIFRSLSNTPTSPKAPGWAVVPCGPCWVLLEPRSAPGSAGPSPVTLGGKPPCFLYLKWGSWQRSRSPFGKVFCRSQRPRQTGRPRFHFV